MAFFRCRSTRSIAPMAGIIHRARFADNPATKKKHHKRFEQGLLKQKTDFPIQFSFRLTCKVPLLRCNTMAERVRNQVRRKGKRTISSASRAGMFAPACGGNGREKMKKMTTVIYSIMKTLQTVSAVSASNSCALNTSQFTMLYVGHASFQSLTTLI